MKRFATLVGSILLAGGLTATQAELKIDFNSTTQDQGPHLELGYQPYNAGHEVPTDFVPQAYPTTFAGSPTVILTPAWPSTTDARVMQMIDRTDQDASGNVLGSFDSNWAGNNINLVTDFIGIDSRTGNGGNGDWDGGSVGSPTYLTLTLGGLPAGTYDWLSYHHDTEYVWSRYQVEVSVDGFTFSPPALGQMTDSTVGGSPASPVVHTGDADPDPANLPSTFTTSFESDGVLPVVLRFAPYYNPATDPVPNTHTRFFGINGFELTAQSAAIPEPSTLAFGALFLALVGLARRIRG